ncbi:MAG: hypothetical protein IPJ06_07810 [Saprospiraceae bacterium]|nr:hypothetical protein [Saprospiraceae bacterium]
MAHRSFRFCFLLGCSTEQSTPFIILETPCEHGGEPNLFVSPDGTAFSLRIEYIDDSTNALHFSTLRDGKWSAPQEIAQGTNWFVNWADFPSVSATGNWMAAHWLQKSASGPYDYDVHISRSQDGGKHWSPAFIPHRDSISAEHGFVSICPLSPSSMLAVWLDGRNATDAASEVDSQDADDHGHQGSMTLRCAEFDVHGNLFAEEELDHRVCDCCQTDMALTSSGPVVVYRDRTEHEIRDISMVRRINNTWTKPHSIYADNWEIAGCPVNGPAVSAAGDQIAVAWYTASQDMPRVMVAFSEHQGKSFSNPIRIDDGNPLGRVDICMINEHSAYVIWIEKTEQTTEIRMAKVSIWGKEGKAVL